MGKQKNIAAYTHKIRDMQGDGRTIKEVDIMEEFVFDVLLLVIGFIIGRGFTLDQIEER